MRDRDATYFDKIFGHQSDVKLWNGRSEEVPWDQIRGLLLTGGSDISRQFLQQAVADASVIQDPDLARDAWEFEFTKKALQQRLPLLAICRGMQVLNVALGGTLHLDIPNHDDAKTENVQELRYEPGARFQFPKVNSSHHQAVDRIGPGLVVEARCATDDVIEQVRLVDRPFGIGTQYHPERDTLYAPLFRAFVDQVESTLA